MTLRAAVALGNRARTWHRADGPAADGGAIVPGIGITPVRWNGNPVGNIPGTVAIGVGVAAINWRRTKCQASGAGASGLNDTAAWDNDLFSNL